MQGLVADLIDSVLRMPEAFTAVVGNDPIAALMFVLGTLLFAVSFGVFGYLSAGAVASLFIPEPSGPPPTREGR